MNKRPFFTQTHATTEHCNHPKHFTQIRRLRQHIRQMTSRQYSFQLWNSTSLCLWTDISYTCTSSSNENHTYNDIHKVVAPILILPLTHLIHCLINNKCSCRTNDAESNEPKELGFIYLSHFISIKY